MPNAFAVPTWVLREGLMVYFGRIGDGSLVACVQRMTDAEVVDAAEDIAESLAQDEDDES